MGNTSSQPEPFPEIPEDFGDIVPETPNSSMVDGRKHKKKKHLSSATKVSSPAIAEANGTKRFAELDSNMSNPSKRKRESEPERKRKSKKHRKSEKFVAESASPENNASPSASAIQIPPTPSQPTSSKIKPKSKSSTKKVRKQNGEDLTTPVSSIPESTPELTAAEEPLAVKQLAATKQPQALDSPNPEGSTTPGFRAKRVRGSRTREKDNLKIGFYTPDEVRKIEAYKLNFCTMHGIASAKFDEMVQHSERGANGEFPLSSDIISKSNFWNEIYALVPDRDRRSVYRFMRRHFQTSAQKAHDWSKEQEDELIELHTKYGPKWTFIGKLIGRSDDDVTQRWKNKLEHQGTMNQGAWLEEETRLFLSVVESTWLTMKPLLADNSGKDMYELDERLIVWGNVSKEMGYMRSRQQCADKWRKIVKQVMMMRANGHPGAVFDPKLAAKKSAIWNRRLEAQRKSSQFVNEDSDEDETTKTTNPKLKLSGEVAPSTIANANFESDEGELELPEPSKKAKKSKSKRKHNENPASGPIKEAPLSPATPKKSKEERKREKMERRKKGEQENIEQEAQEDKAARKDRKRKRKEEKEKKKKKQKRLEEEERLAAEAANKAPSSDAEAPEPPKRKKSKKQKQSSSDSPAPLDELSHPMVESSLPTASPASRQSGIEQDAVVDETDLDGGDNDSSEVNVKYETDSDEL